MNPRQYQIVTRAIGYDEYGTLEAKAGFEEAEMSWDNKLFPGVTGTPRAALLEEQLSIVHELLDNYDVPKAGLSLWERVKILGERCEKAKSGSTS